jgi:hypothetical protein
MPLKTKPSPQLQTYEQAMATVALLKHYGVPVKNISEEDQNTGVVVSVNDPDYQPDLSRPFLFEANVFGQDMALGEIQNRWDNSGEVSVFDQLVALAEVANPNTSIAAAYAQSVEDVLALPVFAAAIRSVK